MAERVQMMSSWDRSRAIATGQMRFKDPDSDSLLTPQEALLMPRVGRLFLHDESAREASRRLQANRTIRRLFALPRKIKTRCQETPSELNEILRRHSDDLTRTAVEQDLLDGGTGRPIYVFKPEEALNPGWGGDGAPNDKNIGCLFSEKK